MPGVCAGSYLNKGAAKRRKRFPVKPARYRTVVTDWEGREGDWLQTGRRHFDYGFDIKPTQRADRRKETDPGAGKEQGTNRRAHWLQPAETRQGVGPDKLSIPADVEKDHINHKSS
ncbi:hypothetical protein BDBG_01715 [Blastomyces gilchristii SLH14081]|uniref:Uncharacterized protein n=1 Tax=Blastomyces gilchristii (strain SLH14081) TaxID=559298 RepID=A0A179UBA6_BLAGS|nr:uncharacterized protein BDBG_01715 [Blastomyces gilchristii SLH14081]OAT05296.1 hypothetical protein BDBG_01715 [Blastomyces gilchristii SLH14081]